MRQLATPLPIWKNGTTTNCNAVQLTVVFDNLKDSAAFKYDLLEVVAVPGVDGGEPTESITSVVTDTLYMSPEEYDLWGIAPDINTAAYLWAAEKLNLELDL